MVRRISGTALLALLLALPLVAVAKQASAREKDPKPLEPLSSIKPHEGKPGEGDGYFDEVFGLDDAGKQLAVIRGDGATFSRIETYNLEAKPPKLTASFDPPSKNLIVTRIELDVYYVDHRSVALDLRILAKTAAMLVTGHGLYKGETGGWRPDA